MKSKPSIRDLAKACGISRTTASAALRGMPGVSEETRKKIKRLAEKIGYIADPKVAQVMSYIANPKGRRALQTIALVGAPELYNPPPWLNNGLLNRFYNGVKQRTLKLGYGFETFWMEEPNLTKRRLAEIMYSRGIDGFVLVLDYGKDPTSIDFDYDKFAVSVIGTSLIWPQLYAAEGNLHQGMMLAMSKAASYGYKRPGLLIRNSESGRADHTWEAGYYFSQSRLLEENRIPIKNFTRDDTSGIREWYDRHRPDVIIGHQPPGIRLLNENHISVPKDVAFIALEMHDMNSDIAGVNIQPENIGAVAVDLLALQFKTNQKGIPEVPQTVLIDCEWHDGTTLPDLTRQTQTAEL